MAVAGSKFCTGCEPLGERALLDVLGTMAKTSPVEFIQQVSAEASKVVWPTRRETAITTAMVFVFVLIASIFFFVADMVLRVGVTWILGYGQ